MELGRVAAEEKAEAGVGTRSTVSVAAGTPAKCGVEGEDKRFCSRYPEGDKEPETWEAEDGDDEEEGLLRMEEDDPETGKLLESEAPENE